MRPSCGWSLTRTPPCAMASPWRRSTASSRRALTTETTSTTPTVGQSDYEVNVVDERELVDRDNLMNYEFETSVQNEDGETVTETHPLSDFASLKSDLSVASVSRETSSDI